VLGFFKELGDGDYQAFLFRANLTPFFFVYEIYF